MKILNWNIRGAGLKDFGHQVHWNYHPDILVSVRTKVNSQRAKFIIKKFNCSHFVEIPPVGLGGVYLEKYS